ncbi:MAG: TonB-dependent receptor [Myxococcales bacterium]|nr:TonB-dependent receptor [Myxococcales bacterium]
MIACGLAAVLTTTRAAADEREPTSRDAPPAYRTTVRDAREDPLDEQRRIDARAPGFATAIDLERDVGARPADSLAEVLARSAGIHVRSMGGLGQFSSLSIRGSTGQQVAVYLDGVPITGSMMGLFNIGDQPLDALGRVEVYRGHVPIVFGGAAIGGAVNLVSARDCPKDGDAQLEAGAGFGSFLSRQADVTVALGLPRRLCLQSQLSYAGSRGDFPYYDNGSTPLVPENDQTSSRENNQYDRAQGRVGLSGRRGPWRFHVQQLALVKRQGLPGIAESPATVASLDTYTARALGYARRAGLGGPGGRLELVGAVSFEGRVFLDSKNEVGLGANNQRTRAVDVYLSPRLRLPLWTGAFLGSALDPRLEWLRTDERVNPSLPLGYTGDRVRARVGGGLELEQFLLDDHLLLAPGVRLDVLYSEFSDARDGEARGAVDHAAIAASPRLGVKLALAPWLSLRSSVGRYFRAPTMFELFSDVGYAVGAPTLRPERGTTLDAGFVFDVDDQPLFTLRAHVAAFRTRAQDMIIWRQAGPRISFVNASAALVAGVESSVDLAMLSGDIALTGNYTRLFTFNAARGSNEYGFPLMGVPTNDLFLRPSWGHRWRVRSVALAPRVFYTYEHLSGYFLDPSGRHEDAPRRFHGLGLELAISERVSFALELRNLTNISFVHWKLSFINDTSFAIQQLADVAGNPLPGRSLWATLRITPTRARARD